MLNAYQPQHSEPAAPWIQLIWEWEGYTSPAPVERILPHSMVEVSWNLSQAHQLWDGVHTARVEHAALLGPRDRAYFVDTAKRAHLFGIVFQPGAISSFLGISAEELAGGFFALDDFPAGAQLQAMIGEARTARERRLATLSYFAAQDTRPKNSEALVLVNAWRQAFGRSQRSVGHMRDLLSVSSPTLVSRARQQLGLRPAQLRQVLMFKEAVETVAWRDRPLVQAALDVGYCDQAHLNRAFRRHAGITPRQFRPFDPEHPFNLAAG